MKISMLTPAVWAITTILTPIMKFAKNDDENIHAQNAGGGNHAGEYSVRHNEDDKNAENDDAPPD